MFKKSIAVALCMSLGLLAGCSHRTVLVPHRMDLGRYDVIGVVDYVSNADTAINRYATQQLQEYIQSAQPGTRFIELGSMDSALAAVGAKQIDVESIKRIGKKYRVAAFFYGNITYSDPTTNVRVTDVVRLRGSVRRELKGDIATKLVETQTGASVWSNSAWVKKTLGGVDVGDQGVAVVTKDTDQRYEMVPSLIFHLTPDFRPSRQKVE